MNIFFWFSFISDYVIDDMVLSEPQYNAYLNDIDNQTFLFARNDPSYRWPNGEMPLDIDNDTIPEKSDHRTFLEGSISEMNHELCGCFRFRYVQNWNIFQIRFL